MKGTDITAEQYDAARRFIVSRDQSLQLEERSDDTQVLLVLRELIGLVAWYGAMRYIAGREGINSLDRPGDLVTVPAGTREPTA